MKWNAPSEIGDLHPVVDGWTRRHQWVKSRKGGHFEAIYTKAKVTRRVVIAENVARNTDGSLWAIKRELRPRRKPFLRGTRAKRPGGGTSAAVVARETTAADLDGAS